MNFKIILTGIFVVLLVGTFSTIGMVSGLYNEQNVLKQQILAKQKNNQSEFDNMWKKIKQVSNVSDKYKNGFVESLTSYANARGSKGGGSVQNATVSINALHEAIPNLSADTYKQLNNIISSSRDRFTEQQKQLLDMEREYNTLITRFPNVVIFKVMNISEIHTKIVTSDKTDKAFETGKDNDITL